MTAVTHDTHDVDRPYPPIGWLSTGALLFMVTGGILLASYAPRIAPLAVAVTMLGVGAALLLGAGLLLSRLTVFAWSTVATVFKWALLAYTIPAGMIELAFVRDHTRGSSLVIVSLMLVVFALSVPTTIAFTVARFADPD